MARNSRVPVICPVCCKEFLVKPSRLYHTTKGGWFVHCSKECGFKSKAQKNSRQVIKSCLCCGGVFSIKQSHEHKKIFCQPKCRSKYWRKTKCQKVHCEVCNKEFEVSNSRKLRRAAKHCSVECAQKNRPSLGQSVVQVVCYICQKEFFAPSCRFDKNNVRFCSKTCHGEFQYREAKKNREALNLKTRSCSCREYRQWRQAVYQRDNYTCQECGDSRGGNLEAHHIKSVSEYPELIYDINNGLTLCEPCHKKTDNWGPKNRNCKINRQKIHPYAKNEKEKPVPA